MAGEGDNTGEDSAAKIAKAMQSLLDRKGGDSSEVIKMLLKENYGLRDDKRDLKKELEDLKGQSPEEGAVVLTGDDVATWNSFKELGKTVKEVTESFTKNEELQGELDERDHTLLVHSAAKVAGFNPKVLADLAGAKGLTIEMKDVEVKGDDDKITKTPTAFVKAGEKGEAVELTAYAESSLKDHLPSLTNTEAGGEEKPGTTFPSQHRSDKRPGSKQTSELAKKAVSKVASQYKTPGQRKAEKE
jgi:hypothetical protein